MAFLLDTVTLSELRKKSKGDRSVMAWQKSERGLLSFVSVITMNEIRFGAKRVARKDAGFAARLELWYAEILEAPEMYSILPVDLRIAEVAADFRADLGLSFNDSLLAATAEVNGLMLATRNVADFEKTGIALLNPWDYGE